MGTSYKLDLFNPDPAPDPVDLSTPREPGYEEVEMDGGVYKGIVSEGGREGQRVGGRGGEAGTGSGRLRGGGKGAVAMEEGERRGRERKSRSGS